VNGHSWSEEMAYHQRVNYFTSNSNITASANFIEDLFAHVDWGAATREHSDERR